MGDNLLYTFYMKSNLYTSSKDEVRIDIENGDKIIIDKRNSRLYEPNNRHSMYVDINEEDNAFKSENLNLRKSNRSLSRSLPDLILTTKIKNNRNKINSSDLYTNKNSSYHLDEPMDLNEEIKLKQLQFEEETKIKFNLNEKQSIYPLPKSIEQILSLSNLSYIGNFNLQQFFYNQSLVAKDAVSASAKSSSWLSNVFGCLMPIWSTIGKNKMKQNNWEIQFDLIRNLEWINSGSQGVVFKGYYNNRLVAVKKVREKSETEIKHLKKLKHKNVINFLGVCTVAPCYCVIMEFAEKGPLSDILITMKEQIDPLLISEWASQIANGMNYLHYNGVIHRDLKSANILVSEQNILKISDFGTSRQRNDQHSTKMSFAGTYSYMAPEVIKNEKCSEKIDVWSFGVVLWELLTCEVPYRGVESSRIIIGVGYNQLKLHLPSTCPEGLKLLMTMCWSLQPTNRPSFRQILLHLQIYCKEFMQRISIEQFNLMKAQWRKEIQESLAYMKSKINYSSGSDDDRYDLIEKRKLELEHAKDIRIMYEQKLNQVNELYDEVNTLLLSLKEKEEKLKILEKQQTKL